MANTAQETAGTGKGKKEGEEINYLNKIICGHTLDILKQLPNEIFDTIITSPPYWGLRDYGVEGQIGLESTLDLYLSHLWQITDELYRVLKKTGVMYWNHGDCYASNGLQRFDKNKYGGKSGIHCGRARTKEIQSKCMVMQNYRLILGIIDRGWILRNTIIWNKPNHMPSSVKDRFTSSYEPVFMLVKNKKYWFDLDAVRQPHKDISKERISRAVSNQHKYIDRPEYGGGGGINKPRPNRKTKIPSDTAELFGSPRARYHRQFNMAISQYQYGEGDYLCVNLHPSGKNPGDVWTIPTQPFPNAHFATFPEKLIEPMILSSCPQWICKKCGKARVRIVKPTNEYKKHLNGKGFATKDWQKEGGGCSKADNYPSLTASYQTIGWSDCGCNAGWRAGITFDPFIGSGTTGLVAKKLGRNYSGIELNPTYKKMADKRLMAIPDSLFKCH